MAKKLTLSFTSHRYRSRCSFPAHAFPFPVYTHPSACARATTISAAPSNPSAAVFSTM
jgi:hypothetical protein